MNYKQKYKEAIEKATALYNVAEPMSTCNVLLETIFPELKEREDKMIRRCISDTVRKYGVEFTTGIITKEKMLAWIEKQGEQLNKVSIWKHWKGGIAGNTECKPIFLIKEDNTYTLASFLSHECDYIELSELDNLMIEKNER